MQNQQTQQNPQNGTQPFFPIEQGPNNFDPYQIGTENNSNAPDPNMATRQGSEISSQIGGAAIGGAAINGAATGALQTESLIPGVQEPLDTQTLPNAIDNATQESALNSEISGMNTEAANITPFPSRESQSSEDEQNKDDQTQTDGLPHMTLDNRGDSLSEENQKFVKKLIEDASEDPFKFYREATEARKEYSKSIRGDAA
jgi:hypothetical protein